MGAESFRKLTVAQLPTRVGGRAMPGKRQGWATIAPYSIANFALIPVCDGICKFGLLARLVGYCVLVAFLDNLLLVATGNCSKLGSNSEQIAQILRTLHPIY